MISWFRLPTPKSYSEIVRVRKISCISLAIITSLGLFKPRKNAPTLSKSIFLTRIIKRKSINWAANKGNLLENHIKICTLINPAITIRSRSKPSINYRWVKILQINPKTLSNPGNGKLIDLIRLKVLKRLKHSFLTFNHTQKFQTKHNNLRVESFLFLN